MRTSALDNKEQRREKKNPLRFNLTGLASKLADLRVTRRDPSLPWPT